jgi:hypothetical protein
MCGVYTAAWVMPEIAKANPGYVNDVMPGLALRASAASIVLMLLTFTPWWLVGLAIDTTEWCGVRLPGPSNGTSGP